MNDEIRTNTIFVGRYQVQRELGRGGMGSVYLAFDLQHRRQVAIKVARLAGPEARAQFRREALYLQKLHHHSLPRVWDTFSDTQRDFLVMEFIPGEDLETLVQQQGPQPEWLVLRWADELLDVLDYLHTQNPPIIHRDVKPGNLKLRQNDTLVLVDFGIAKEYMPESDAYEGASAVTPGFSPPEQYADSLADERTDVYSAGATLYYLLTGVIPAAAPDRASGEAALAPVTRLAPETSGATDVLLRQALQLTSEERWGNAAEMRRAAVVASRKLASVAPPPPAPEPSIAPSLPARQAAPGKRRIGCAVASALAGIALLAVAALLWTFGGARQPGAPSLAQANPAGAAAATTASLSPDEATLSAGAPGKAVAPPSPAATETTQPTAVIAAQEPAVTPSPTATPVPTSTPIPTHTPTPGGSPTPTAPPTATPTPTATRTPVSVRRTPAPASATPVPTATQPAPPTQASTPVVTLIEPGPGAIGAGVRLFSWQASQSPAATQGFELVFWRPGQDAVRDAFGPIGVSQDSSGQMRVDLDRADQVLGALFDPGDYLWGVMLVQTAPYQRVALVSEPRAFRFERGGGSGQAAPPQEPQQPTQPPPPPTLVP
jgi:serine/threonine protein kinase